MGERSHTNQSAAAVEEMGMLGSLVTIFGKMDRFGDFLGISILWDIQFNIGYGTH